MRPRRAITIIGACVLGSAAAGVFASGIASPATTHASTRRAACRSASSRATDQHGTVHGQEDVVAGVFSTRGAACAELKTLDKRGFHDFGVTRKQARTTSSAVTGTNRSPIKGSHGALSNSTAGSRAKPSSSSRTAGAGGTSTAGIRFEDVEAFSSKKKAAGAADELRHHGLHATVKAATGTQ